MIFTSGKGPFLEFLRNLTPQILLFSIAIVLGTKLDLNRWDFSNTVGTLPFLFVMAVFFSAAIANMLNFLENSISSIEWLDAESKALREQGIKRWKHLRMIASIFWKRGKLIFVEMIIAMLIVQVGFSVVFVSSIQAATNLYLMIHPKI